MGRRYAANLGEKVELEERGVQLDDLPITGCEGLDMQGVRRRWIYVELNGDLELGA